MSRGRGRRAVVWGVDSQEGPEDKPTLGRRALQAEGGRRSVGSGPGAPERQQGGWGSVNKKGGAGRGPGKDLVRARGDGSREDRQCSIVRTWLLPHVRETRGEAGAAT